MTAHGEGRAVFGKRLNERLMRNCESYILVECIDSWLSKHVGNITKCPAVTGESSASQRAVPCGHRLHPSNICWTHSRAQLSHAW